MANDEMPELPSFLKVSVWRGGEKGDFRQYSVPARGSQTVLDVVTWIQRNVDSTLSYRFACRVGMCGSCAMSVNGMPCWTCRTHVTKVVKDGKVSIGPLANLPIVKDLAVDMRVFFEKWTAARGVFVAGKSRDDEIERIKPSEPARIAADAAIECINCGVCYAACDTVRWNGDYLGPAALNRAWSLINDRRDTASVERLAAVSENGGCHNCHSHQSCQALCPQSLNPTGSIAALKRASLRAQLASRAR